MHELDTAVWCEINPHQCPCGGHGWLHSDYDTYHRCAIHGEGVPHPEDEEAEFDFPSHSLRIHREAWRRLQQRSGMDRGTFRAAVESHVRSTVRAATFQPTMHEWVDFADEVSTEARMEALDERARRMGYSCRLEAAWAADAEIEAHARAAGIEPEQYASYSSPEAADRNSWY